jgi:hypothetical protein
VPNTTRRGFYAPYGVLKGSVNAAGTGTTFHVTNADSADMAIGDNVKVYAVASGIRSLRGDIVTISNIQADTPSAGTTRVTFSPTLASSSASGDEVYSPEIVDVETWVSNNMPKADQVLGAFRCTSTSRPSSPPPDMIIYEWDTGDLRRWDSVNTTWTRWNNSSRPVGYVGKTVSQLAGASTVAGAITGPYLPLTGTFIKDQWYRIFITLTMEVTVGQFGEAFASIKRGTGGSVNTGSSEIALFSCDPNTPTDPVPATLIFPYLHGQPTGTYTVGVFCDRSGQTGSETIRFGAQANNQMTIEGIGKL